jgi:putative ABC transport system substrate-binding protein
MQYLVQAAPSVNSVAVLHHPGIRTLHRFGEPTPALCLKYRLPLVGVTEFGALLQMYSSELESPQRSARLTANILRGAQPAELPVEQAEGIFLSSNLKTAQAPGLKIPQALLLRADEVIR